MARSEWPAQRESPDKAFEEMPLAPGMGLGFLKRDLGTTKLTSPFAVPVVLRSESG